MHTSIVIHEWGMKLGIFPILSHQIIPWGVGNHSERSKDLIHISHISELHIGNEIRICAKLLFDSRNLRISAFHLMIFLHAIIIVSLGALQKQDWKCFSILTRVLTDAATVRGLRRFARFARNFSRFVLKQKTSWYANKYEDS